MRIGLIPLEFVPFRLDGDVWAAGWNDDRGMAVRIPSRLVLPQLTAAAAASQLRPPSCFPLPEAPVAELLEEDAEEGAPLGVPLRLRLGELLLAARFVGLVDALYPGCEWRAPPREALSPAQAWRGGELVALVMPLAETADHERAARERGLLPREDLTA